jgi:response regulator receiver domain-containing protein
MARATTVLTPVAQGEDLRGLQVLLVEDNAVNQKLMFRILEKLGADVTVADDGEAAIAKLTATRFEVVLMDCQMPVLGQDEILERATGIEPTRAALPSLQNKRFAANAGAKCDWRANFRVMRSSLGPETTHSVAVCAYMRQTRISCNDSDCSRSRRDDFSNEVLGGAALHNGCAAR